MAAGASAAGAIGELSGFVCTGEQFMGPSLGHGRGIGQGRGRGGEHRKWVWTVRASWVQEMSQDKQNKSEKTGLIRNRY